MQSNVDAANAESLPLKPNKTEDPSVKAAGQDYKCQDSLPKVGTLRNPENYIEPKAKLKWIKIQQK